MALDLAIGPDGDLLIAPNNDIDVRTGQATVDQRIRVRLLVQPVWALDPSNGQLGSRLHEALRLPIWRSRQEIPLMVREALEPMTDISVHEVVVEQDPDNPRANNIVILYAMVDDGGTPDQLLSTTLTIEG